MALILPVVVPSTDDKPLATRAALALGHIFTREVFHSFFFHLGLRDFFSVLLSYMSKISKYFAAVEFPSYANSLCYK